MPPPPLPPRARCQFCPDFTEAYRAGQYYCMHCGQGIGQSRPRGATGVGLRFNPYPVPGPRPRPALPPALPISADLPRVLLPALPILADNHLRPRPPSTLETPWDCESSSEALDDKKDAVYQNVDQKEEAKTRGQTHNDQKKPQSVSEYNGGVHNATSSIPLSPYASIAQPRQLKPGKDLPFGYGLSGLYVLSSRYCPPDKRFWLDPDSASPLLPIWPSPLFVAPSPARPSPARPLPARPSPARPVTAAIKVEQPRTEKLVVPATTKVQQPPAKKGVTATTMALEPPAEESEGKFEELKRTGPVNPKSHAELDKNVVEWLKGVEDGSPWDDEDVTDE